MILILTDDREKYGHFTKWAEIEKENIQFLKKCFDFFMKSATPEEFIIYDTETQKAGRLKNLKFTEVQKKWQIITLFMY